MTSDAATLRVDGATLSVQGPLTVSTVAALLPDGRRALAGLNARRAVLDLERVSSADSTGLALVVDWLRTARSGDTVLEVRGVPEQLSALAEVSGLQELLRSGGRNGP